MSYLARVVAALVLLSLAGCGGTGPTGSAAPTAAPTATTTATTTAPSAKAANPLTEAQLEAAALKPGDLTGYQIDTHPNMHDNSSTAKPAACQPLENVRTAALDPKPAATVGFLAWKTSAPSQGLAVDIELNAYTDLNAAREIVAKLREAVSACGSGYAGGVLRFPTVTGHAAPGVGDETVSFKVAGPGASDISWYTVVRVGATLVVFDAAGPGPDGDTVPEDLVRAQAAKVGKAQS